MIKICVTLNEGQGQYRHFFKQVMHSHTGGRHRAKFDDDNFNSF